MAFSIHSRSASALALIVVIIATTQLMFLKSIVDSWLPSPYYEINDVDPLCSKILTLSHGSVSNSLADNIGDSLTFSESNNGKDNAKSDIATVSKVYWPEPFKCLAEPLSITSHLSGQNKNAKLVSVVIPAYKGPHFTQEALQIILNQTYPHSHLEILISIDKSEDSAKSESIARRFHSENPNLNFQIFSQQERLHWVANINFLLTKSTGDYVAIYQQDDWIPPNYLEKLADCLDNDPNAVMCFPYVKSVLLDDWSKKSISPPKIVDSESIIGSQYERVDKSMASSPISVRGMMRRPLDGSIVPYLIPRLYKNYHYGATLQRVNHAIAGNLRRANVAYHKRYYRQSVHNLQRHNSTVMSAEGHMIGLLDWALRNYEASFAYASSSKVAYESSLAKLKLPKETGIKGSPEEIENLAQKAVVEFNKRVQLPKRVVILGAGIQGCIMALMFRKHGYDVTVIDKSDDIMNRASSHGEGKVHLGLVYNKDLTMKTAEHMMQSALRFSSYIEYLVGRPIHWELLKSKPFTYMIPFSSSVSPKEFEQFATKLEDIYEKILMEEPNLSYLGHRPPNLIERSSMPIAANASFFEAAYDSVEYSVSPEKLKAVLKEALKEQSIKLVFGRNVVKTQRNDPGDDVLGKFRVISNVGEHDFDVVVNCLWEGRASIDKKLGVNFSSGNNYRFKFGIKFPHMAEYSELPSMTIVNGPFGDFVQYTKDSGMYFSYYPVSLMAMTTNTTVMEEWDALADGNIPGELELYQLESHKQAFKSYFPGCGDAAFRCPRLGGGYILGNGITDITDSNSELHKRSDFPFVIEDGYISVSTQKFTSAPQNAFLLEKAIFDKEELS